ncbi:HAD-IA family hydrolase [bacterium]|nr:HAD-IA family hydrolase [bacterium]
MIKSVGFDLDNTLCDQTVHILSFLRDAAKWLSCETGFSDARIYHVFKDILIRRTPAYKHLFDDALDALNIPKGRYVNELIDKYHCHRGGIELYPGTRQILECLYKTKQLFLITDGHSGMQRMKVEQLAISQYFAVQIFTGGFDKSWTKPSVLAYESAASKIGVKTADCIFVGDNPCRDFDGAHRIGMKTIRVLTGPYAKLSSIELNLADYTIETLSELNNTLQLITR